MGATIGNGFTKEEYEKLMEFNDFIAQRAKFDNMSANDIMYAANRIHNHNTITEKVKAHIAEVVGITDPNTANIRTRKAKK